MKNSIFNAVCKTRYLALLVVLIFTCGNVWGAEKTITLTHSSFSLTTTYAKKTATVSSIGFTVDQGYKGTGDVIQMNSSKGSGILYNTTAIKGLKSIAVTVSSGSKTYTITTGTSEKPTANSQTGTDTKTFNAKSGDTYFQLKVSGASYFSKIVITYDDAAATKTYYEWNGSSYETSTESGTSISKNPTPLCSVGAAGSYGWITEEYANTTAPSPRYWKNDTWPTGKTKLYAVYYYDAGEGNAYYSTHPTIYNVTYSTTHATLDEDYSYTCTTDILDLASATYGSFVYAYYTPASGYSLDETCFTFTYTSGGATFTPSDMSYNSTTGALWIDGVDGNITITAVAKTCTKLADATNLAVQNPSTSDATKIKFTWTLGAGTSTNATKQVLTLSKVGGASQSVDRTKTQTSGSLSLSSLSDGTYNWSIQAIGDGVSYCDGNVVEGPSFTICNTDITSSTPDILPDTPGKTSCEVLFDLTGANSYTVTLKNNSTGDVISGYDHISNTTGDITFTGLTPSTTYRVEVTGHNACGDNTLTGSATFTTADLTLYTVTFVNQSGTAVSPVTQTTEEGNVTLPSASPSAACAALGWSFAGWKDNSAQTETTSAPTLIAAGSYTPSGNKTFYAVYTMTESGGGTPKTTLLTDDFSSVSIGSGQNFVSSTGYIYSDVSGYIRLGKNSNDASSITSKSLSASVGTTVTVSVDIAKYNLSDGGDVTITVSDVGTETITWATDLSGQTATQSPETFTKTFVTATASFTVTIGISKKRILLDNVEVYYGGGGSSTTYWNSNPSCSSEATVTYHNNGAQSGSAPTDPNSPYTIGDNVTVLGSGTMVAPAGKEFKCWNTASDGTGTDYNIGAKFDIAGNMDFYPKWVNAPYTVYFNAEGGTCGTASSKEASGGAGVTLPAATAPCATAGWSFYGWATSASTSTTSAPTTVGTTGATYYPESDITLHAVYVNSGTYNSNPVCYEVTIGSHTNGTIKVNSSTASPQTVTQGATVNIAATPESGYNFTTWTITKTTGGDDVTSTLLGANATTASTSFTMPDYDVTVSVTFTAKVIRNIIWKNNGVELTAAERGSANTSMEVGEKLTAIPTLASGAAGKSCDTEGHPTFVGWTATPWNGEESTAAGLFTADNLPTMPAGEGPITYHAVWADGSGVFELVTSAPSNWSGTYLIVSGTHAMSSDFYSGTSGEFKASEVTISNNKIECTDDKLIWIVAKNGDNAQYSFKNKSTGTYAKITGTSSTNAALDANAVWFTIENASGNIYDIASVNNSARCFAYYASNTSFRTYAKSNYNTGSLYKASEATSYITSCSCPAYSFHFGTRSQSDWSDKDSYCFQESTDPDGNSGVYWYLEDFELPAKPHYYVGWQGSWNTTDAKSADADFSDLVYGLLRANSCGTQTLGTYSSGNNQGAIGTLRVRSSYTDNNKYIDFIPGGYVLRLSDNGGSSYTSTELIPASESLTETVWMTDITTVSEALASNGKFFVDLKTSSDHVWAPNMSEVANISSMGYKKDGGSSAGSWGTGLSAGMRGKFRIWADNCSKNWNAHFVPYYHLSYDGNGAGATNLPEASDDKSCEGNDAARTVVVSSTVPTRDGYTFLGWAESTAHATAGTVDYTAGNNIILTADKTIYAVWAQNFTVTYNLGGGTASPECTGGTYYVGETVDVCTSTPTRVSSSFLGWLVYKTGDKSTMVTVTAGQFTMPAYNVTVEAQWKTVYYHIYYKEEDETAIATDDVPQTAETTLRNQTPCVGYTFFGWSTSKITTETTTKPTGVTFIGKGGASYTPTSDITVYPVYARSEGATTVKDTLTVANTGVTTSYTPLSGINKNSTPKTIHSDAVYAIGAYKSSGMQFTDGTSNEDQKKSSLITTTSGGSLQSIRARIPYDCSTTRYLYTNGNTSDYIMQQRSSQGGTLAWTVTHSTKANTWYSHDFSEDGYTSFFMYCGGGATKVDSIIVTWGTGTYYYATHCETKENVTITYNGNGGIVGCGSPVDSEVTTVTWDYADGGMGAPTLAESQTICNSATRAGYILNKWNTAADGTGRDYAKGATVTRFGGDSTLYAIWDRVYTVTLYDNGVERETLVEASAGAGVTLPSGNNCGAGSAFTFEGWTESAVKLNADPVRPATLHAAGAYAPTSDITLYSVYSKSVAGCEDFAEGVSGAYKMYYDGSKYATTAGTSGSYTGATSGTAEVFYIAYAPAHTGYTIRTSTGFVGWNYNGEELTKGNATPYYWKISGSSSNWVITPEPSAYTKQLKSTDGNKFQLYAAGTTGKLLLQKSAMTYYYNTAICEESKITFHDGGGTISGTPTTPTGASWNSSTHVLSGLEDCDKITTFPTASYDGWTFIGWSTEDYSNSGKHTTDHPEENASTDEPDGSEIYKTDGNPYVVRGGSIDLYPIFTRFPDNEPFNEETGGRYYIYYLKPGTDDGYGSQIRVYAGERDNDVRYKTTKNCASAVEFNFVKDGDIWHIIDTKNGNKYVAGVSGNDNLNLVDDLSGTCDDWTITIKSGNQFYASCQSGGRYISYSTSANYFMDYSTTANPDICLPVYLGTCTERIFSSDPNPTPTIDLDGEPYVTSSNGERVRATATMTLSAAHLNTLPANKVIVSGGTGLKFATTASANPTPTVSLSLTEGSLAATTIYVYYTPSATEDGLENIIVTAKAYNGSSYKEFQKTGTVHARHLPADFVIAAKWNDKWYAMPNTCTSSGSSTTGVLITVDNDNDPTCATYAPMTAKWGMRQTKDGSRTDGSYNDRLVFTERGTTATANSQQALYNYNSADIYTNATYANYNNTNPDRYEWIPVTSDFKDYTLTNANDAGRTLILRNSDGEFKAQNTDQAYDGKVRLLPATFKEDNVQILEWKASSVVIMYTGTETTAKTKVGSNAQSSAQTLSGKKIAHGIYELSAPSLTGNAGNNLEISFGSDASKKLFEIPIIITGNSTAATGHDKQDVVIVKNAKLTAATTKYSYRNIYVYGGGKLNIPTRTALGVNNIILRAGSISTDGAGGSATYEYIYPQVYLAGTFSSTKTDIKYEYITDYTHWYQLCLPFNASLNSIHYPKEYYGNIVTEGNSGSWVIKRYAGEIRATGEYDAWKDIEKDSPKKTEVTAGNGYLFWGAPKNVTIGGDKQRQTWGIQRMTMSVTAAAATSAETANKNISVDSYSEQATSTKPNDQGWNLVGNPYMVNLTDLSSTSMIAGELVKDSVDGKWTGKWKNNGDGVRYVTIPDYHFDNYVAKTASVAAGAGDFMPGRAFFVQIAEGATTLTFAATNRASLMPALFARTEQSTDVETGIVLSDESKHDEVNFWIKDGKTEAYEYNADYPKTMNTTNFNIYGVHSNGELSWVAISPEIAESSMAIGYQVPAAGDYMLSLSETYVSDEIEHVFVTDHGVSPEVTTDLMEEDYNFYVNQAETNDVRFTVAFKLKVEDPGTTTNVENTAGVDSDKPLKFIYNDKMYILRNGIIYDAVGKKVSEINK